MIRRVLAALLLWSGVANAQAVTGGATAALQPVTTLSAYQFTHNVCVNTHVFYTNYPGYATIANVLANIASIPGLTCIRDGVPAYQPGGTNASIISAVFNAGLRWFMSTQQLPTGGSSSNCTGSPAYLTCIKSNLDYDVTNWPGQVAGVEGVNEPNQSTFAYGALTGVSAIMQWQIDLYSMMHADPLLQSIPVLIAPQNYSPYNKLTYEALYNAISPLPYSFDTCNTHAYPQVNQPYASLLSSVWHCLDYGASYGVVGPPGPWAYALHDRPTMQTEMGMLGAGAGYAGSVPTVVPDNTTQAKMLIEALADNFILGQKMVAIYELMDLGTSTAPCSQSNYQACWGLWTYTDTIKPAGTALQNLMGAINDTGGGAATFVATPLPVTVAQFPLADPNGGDRATGATLALEQSSGTYKILVWYEPATWNVSAGADYPVPPSVPITLALGKTCSTTSVYDPLTGTTTAGSSAVSVIRVSLPDHLVVVSCAP